MSLRISRKDNDAQVVELLQVLKRGDTPGTMSDNNNGGRQIYFFRCINEKISIISRSNTDADPAGTTKALELVKELRAGESFEMSITTPTGKQEVIVSEHVDD